MPLYVKKLDQRATLPAVAHPGEDLAYDIFALEDTKLVAGEVTKVRTGVAMRYDRQSDLLSCRYKYGLLIRDRSSMASLGIYVTGGVIDAGYTGEVIVLMNKPFGAPYHIEAGNKIAQVIPLPILTGAVVEVNELNGVRGDRGFGSTGK